MPTEYMQPTTKDPQIFIISQKHKTTGCVTLSYIHQIKVTFKKPKEKNGKETET